MKKIYIILFIFFTFPITLQAQEYCLGPDDVIAISVYREDELNRTLRIAPDGYVSFPLLGKVKAEGYTISELEDKLTRDLKKYLKKPQVTVFIQEYSTITVSGQVAKPGSYPLKGALTALEAISLAGGFTKIAARNDVRVMRIEDGDTITYVIKVADMNKKGDLSGDISLKRGDVVYVPESLF